MAPFYCFTMLKKLVSRFLKVKIQGKFEFNQIEEIYFGKMQVFT